MRYATSHLVFSVLLTSASFDAPAVADTQALVDTIDQSVLTTHVNQLTANPRFSTAQLQAAENYISAALTGYGYSVELGATFDSNFGVRQSRNIWAELPGSTLADEIIVLGAHFDSSGIDDPGADDNASGVAAVLEIARVLAGQSHKRTIRLVAFTFEESGFEGSFHYVQQLAAADDNVIAMLNLEMIAYTCPDCQLPFSDIPGCLYTDPDAVTAGTGIAVTVNNASTSLLNTFMHARAAYVPGLEFFSGTVAGTGTCLPDTRRSDHIWFWDQGIPALMLTDTANFRNPNYHQLSDTVATLDFAFMTNVTKAALATVVTLADQVRYLSVQSPDFIDRAFGVDGLWNTADDYFAAGINPLGLASGFRTIEPTVFAPPGGVYFGCFDAFEFNIEQAARIGSNAFIGGTTIPTVTLFADEADQTPVDPAVFYQPVGELELDPLHVSTLDILDNNSFSSDRSFRYIGTPHSFPLDTHLGGWYLAKSQSATEIFAGQQDLIDYFDAITPHLPTDWEVVFTERYRSDDPNFPGSLYLNNLTFYSNDPSAVPQAVFAVSQATVLPTMPFGGLCLLAGAMAWWQRVAAVTGCREGSDHA